MRSLLKDVLGAPCSIALRKTDTGKALIIRRAGKAVALPITPEPADATWDENALEAIMEGLGLEETTTPQGPE